MESYLQSLKCHHNEGTHYTTGKDCSICGKFVKKDTLEYFMTSGLIGISMVIHNKKVAYIRGEGDPISPELVAIDKRLNDFTFTLLLSEEEANAFMKEVYDELRANNMTSNDATVILK